MLRNCGNCGTEIEVKRWSKCSNCGARNHFKINGQGRIKRHICHFRGRVKIVKGFRNQNKKGRTKKKD